MDLFGLKGFSDYLWNLYEPDTLTKKESETVKDEEIDMDEGANDLDSRCERSTKNEEYYTGQNRINHMDKSVFFYLLTATSYVSLLTYVS